MNLALLSKWHVHADDYVNQIKNKEGINITLIWDEDQERGKKWADDLEVPFEADINKVLQNPEIDGVVVNTPTNMHKDIIIQAAENKKHIFTEKVLAFNIQDVEEIYDAVNENDVKLVVSLPRLTETYFLKARKALEKGIIGDLTTVRCRFAHDGAIVHEDGSQGWLPERFFNKSQTGGGAMIDLGAHPIYLLNRLGGEVTGVYARLHHDNEYDVDVNSVMLVDFASKAIGIIETSFVSYGSPFQLELFGTKGTILISEEDIKITSADYEEAEVQEMIAVEDGNRTPMDQWIDAIRFNKEIEINHSDVKNLTLLNQAAFSSQKENRRVLVDEILNK